MHCLTCGYNLNQLTIEHCPECGRGFDPKDPATWGNARAFRHRRVGTIAGWIAAVIASGFGLVMTAFIARGTDDWLAIVIYGALATIVLVPFLMAWVLCLTAGGRAKPSRRALLLFFFLLVYNISLLSAWPMWASFLLHRGALNDYAQQFIQTPSKVHQGPLQIGLYKIHSVGINSLHNPPHIVFKIHGGDGPDYLVYGMTDNEIENKFNIWSYQRLDQDWHIVHED